MGGGLESRCVVRVYDADGAVHGTIRTVHTLHQAGISLYSVGVAIILYSNQLAPEYEGITIHQTGPGSSVSD